MQAMSELPPEGNAVDEPLGQVRHAHVGLRNLDRVRDAARLPGYLFGIEDGIRGARVVVTRGWPTLPGFRITRHPSRSETALAHVGTSARTLLSFVCSA